MKNIIKHVLIIGISVIHPVASASQTNQNSASMAPLSMQNMRPQSLQPVTSDSESDTIPYTIDITQKDKDKNASNFRCPKGYAVTNVEKMNPEKEYRCRYAPKPLKGDMSRVMCNYTVSDLPVVYTCRKMINQWQDAT